MAYCAPRGIALSVFLDWSVADQQAALSWQAHENRRCQTCGTHPDDWAAGAGAFHAEHYQCPGCVKVQRQQEHPNIKGGKIPGLHVRLRPGPAGCPTCPPT
jgi:hypothetical protein